MSQQTTNYNFNLIDYSDKIKDSLDGLNSNFTSIDTILDSITGLSFQVVVSLPVTGEAGVIYLLANSGTSPNIYDEYIWVNNTYEKIGTTDIDLSGYEQTSNKVTSLSGSSTNTQYPSAKLVYDELADKQEEIDLLKSNLQVNTSSKGTTLTLNDSLNGLVQDVEIYGATSQASTPTLSIPVAVSTVTGDITVTISDGVATQSQLLSLGSLELCKIGTYQDYIYKSGATWYKHKVIAKKTLNGTENWKVSNGIMYADSISDYTRDTFIPFCTAYQGKGNVSSSSGMTDNNTIAFGTSSSANRLFVKDTNYSTADAFISALEINNATLYYALKTEEESDVEITDSTLISQLNALLEKQTYKPSTTIYTTTTNETPELQVDYVAVDYIKNTVITDIWKGNQTAYDNLGTYSNTTLYLIEEA